MSTGSLPEQRPRLRGKKRVLLSILSCIGWLVVAVAFQKLYDLFVVWSELSWASRGLAVAMWAAFLPLGVLYGLLPFGHGHTVAKITKALQTWVENVLSVLAIFQALIGTVVVLLVAFVLPAVLWTIVYGLGFRPPIAPDGFLYISYVVLSLVVTRWGYAVIWLVTFVLKAGGIDHAKVVGFFRPPHMRAYFYLLTAVLYMLANYELFSQTNVIPWHFWVPLKDMLKEVLLSYVAIDAFIAVRREIRASTKGA